MATPTPDSALLSGSLRKIDAVVQLAAKDEKFAMLLSNNPDTALGEFGISLTQTEMVCLLSLMGRNVESVFLTDAREVYSEWVEALEQAIVPAQKS